MGQGEKTAVQARSKQTRKKLVNALDSLLREKAYDEISVADIAQQAGVSVGTVYRRFDNKDALIPVVLELYQARLIAFSALPENQFSPNPEAGLFKTILSMTELSWRFMEHDGHLIRAAFIHARTRPDLIGSEWDDFLEAGAKSYTSILDLFADEIVHEDREKAARMTLYLLNVGMAEYGLYPQEGPAAALTLSPEEFTQALARAIHGYLTLPLT